MSRQKHNFVLKLLLGEHLWCFRYVTFQCFISCFYIFQEIDSLRTVIEMRSSENKELRNVNNKLNENSLLRISPSPLIKSSP